MAEVNEKRDVVSIHVGRKPDDDVDCREVQIVYLDVATGLMTFAAGGVGVSMPYAAVVKFVEEMTRHGLLADAENVEASIAGVPLDRSMTSAERALLGDAAVVRHVGGVSMRQAVVDLFEAYASGSAKTRDQLFAEMPFVAAIVSGEVDEAELDRLCEFGAGRWQ